jgi:arylsulfatase A-like enzyme
VPVFKDDPNGPGAFGFDIWLTVSNFFDIDPLMSLNGEFGQYKGSSSEIIVREALKFAEGAQSAGKPFLAVVWDGSPHSPFKASEADQKAFASLNESDRQHYGELAAFDRSLGKLRAGLRDMGVAENTILWYCSDNGGLKVNPESVGGLRGLKGSVWEGGLRVPGVIEWPAVIKPRITSYPASTIDIFPTIADILGLPASVFIQPVDGVSLRSLFSRDAVQREAPIPFRFQGKGALVDNDYKLVAVNLEKGLFELYNLVEDKAESNDLALQKPEIFARMKAEYLKWDSSATASFEGKDYPEGKVFADEVQTHFWFEDQRYLPYLAEWKGRWEYESYIKNTKAQKNKKNK